MSDKEIRAGNVSILRKARKVKHTSPDKIRTSGLRSFAFQKKPNEIRKEQPVWSKTFSKGLVKSLIRKK